MKQTKSPFPSIKPQMPSTPVGDYPKGNPGEMGKSYESMSKSNAPMGNLSMSDLHQGHKKMGNPPYMSENTSDLKGNILPKKKELRKSVQDAHYNESDTDSFVLGPNT